MFDLTTPPVPARPLNQFVMPGSSDQLILAADGVLGPGTVAFTSGGVPRNLAEAHALQPRRRERDRQPAARHRVQRRLRLVLARRRPTISASASTTTTSGCSCPTRAPTTRPRTVFNPDGAPAQHHGDRQSAAHVGDDLRRRRGHRPHRLDELGARARAARSRSATPPSTRSTRRPARGRSTSSTSSRRRSPCTASATRATCTRASTASARAARSRPSTAASTRSSPTTWPSARRSRAPRAGSPTAVGLAVVFADANTGWQLSPDGRVITALDAAAVKERLTHVRTDAYCALDGTRRGRDARAVPRRRPARGRLLPDPDVRLHGGRQLLAASAPPRRSSGVTTLPARAVIRPSRPYFRGLSVAWRLHTCGAR